MTKLDKIIAQLRSTEPYLPDNGFTAAVMAQLPAKRALPEWVKDLLLLAATAIGSGIAALVLPMPQFLTAALQALPSIALSNINMLTVGVALGVGATLIYTISFSLMWSVRQELL